MTGEHLELVLKNAQAKPDKDGYLTVPEGTTLTLYAAHDGVGLTVSRVDAVKVEGELVQARTVRREQYALVKSDVFAVALEGAVGQPTRRAGFA
jgi:hypothetical protein